MGLLDAINKPSDCAATAEKILADYASGKATSYALTDLLTDLAHLCVEKGWNFEAEARCAVQNSQSERMS